MLVDVCLYDHHSQRQHPHLAIFKKVPVIYSQSIYVNFVTYVILV